MDVSIYCEIISSTITSTKREVLSIRKTGHRRNILSIHIYIYIYIYIERERERKIIVECLTDSMQAGGSRPGSHPHNVKKGKNAKANANPERDLYVIVKGQAYYLSPGMQYAGRWHRFLAHFVFRYSF